MSQQLERFLYFLHSWTALDVDSLRQLLTTLLIVLGYAGASVLGSRLINRRLDDPARRYVVRKVVVYSLTLLLAMALVDTWLGGISGLGTYLGLLSAGALLALGQPVASLAGWFYIVARKPFSVGDRIQIGPHTGDVVDISLLRFSIVEVGNWVAAEQSTGRIIHIPNAWVFTQPTANYTQGFNFIWNEIPVIFTYQSNWPKARQLLAEIGRRHAAVDSEQAAEQVRLAADRFLVHFEHLSPVVWTSAGEKGIVLTLRYLCHPRQRRTTEARIVEDILRTLPAHDDLHLAFSRDLKLFSPQELAGPISPSPSTGEGRGEGGQIPPSPSPGRGPG